MSRGTVSTPHCTTSRAAALLAISDICVDLGEASLGKHGDRRFMWRHTRHFLLIAERSGTLRIRYEN
jgi:hypothetical protein